MRLKSLEIKGFKSFAYKNVLNKNWFKKNTVTIFVTVLININKFSGLGYKQLKYSKLMPSLSLTLMLCPQAVCCSITWFASSNFTNIV